MYFIFVLRSKYYNILIFLFVCIPNAGISLKIIIKNLILKDFGAKITQKLVKTETEIS